MAISPLESRWTSAVMEMGRRSRRIDDDDAKQRPGWRSCGHCSSKYLSNVACNVTIPCFDRRGTYSLCLLSESNVVRRLALSLVQWEYPLRLASREISSNIANAGVCTLSVHITEPCLSVRPSVCLSVCLSVSSNHPQTKPIGLSTNCSSHHHNKYY